MLELHRLPVLVATATMLLTPRFVDACGEGLFAPMCPEGAETLDCVRARVEALGTFMRTPKGRAFGQLAVTPE